MNLEFKEQVLLFRSLDWLLFKDISDFRVFLLHVADKSADLSASQSFRLTEPHNQ